ncbi:AAA family ATPase [Tabrizicola sp. YIM 78059]|uniref:AAA family ATPase n=1 Tax=Tabrizicola sp. YIM 78059 TaxID=2529861 RepID=UPI0010AAF6BF|nr:AAA family ATPase [Tabrizicola sp. YIM 78059]
MNAEPNWREVGREPPPIDVQERWAADYRARAAGDAPVRASQWLCAANLEGLPVPERDWLVPDLIPARNVTLLYGDGGAGKSLLALQLAVAVALGRPWLGLPVKAGTALFPSAEDEEDELHRRLADIVRHEGARLADLTGLTIRSLAGEDAMLARLGDFGRLVSSDLYAEIEALLEAQRPALLVLDTLADLFPGNENDKAQARAFVGLLKRLAIRHECAVVMLAHPSLSGMSSGSGTSGNVAWSGSARSRLYLERVTQDGHEANPDARVLRTMKANYGPRGGEISVTWRDGVFVADSAETGLDRAAGNAKAERVFLSLLRAFTEQGRFVNSAGGLNYAPKVFADHPGAEGLTKHAFRAAMEALLAQGRIAVRQKGPTSRPTTFIAEVVE